MRNRFVFTSSTLLLALHAFGCGASPEPEQTPSDQV
ncbi:carbohydrate-binding protein, partial [Corallococcus praedator]